MSAQEKKFTHAELCQTLWEMGGDQFAKFMEDAIRADIDDRQLLLAFEAMIGRKVAIFASHMKQEGREERLAQIMGQIQTFALAWITLDAATHAYKKAGGDA